jgi:tetratricopeptide (TPR) repeat protein
MRRWDDAERCIQRGLEEQPQAPTFLIYRGVILMLRDGDVAGAQAAVEPLVNRVPAIATFLAEMDVVRRDYARVHERLPSLNAFAGLDTTAYYVQRGTAYWFAEDRERARAYFDSLRVYLETSQKVRESQNPQVLMGYALTLSCLDHAAEAERYAAQAIELLPVSRDAVSGAELINSRMILRLVTGNYEGAIDDLEYLMSIPSTVSPAILRLHPAFDVIRDDPRFKKLAEEKLSL